MTKDHSETPKSPGSSDSLSSQQTYEDVLEKIGACGRYQILLVFLLGWSSIYAAFDLSSIVFMHYTPSFRCYVTNTSNTAVSTTMNTTEDMELITSKDSHYGDQCFKDKSRLQKCEKWIYDRSVMHTTLVTEFDLVCDKSYYTTIAEAIFFLGTTMGMLVMSMLGDRVGRRNAILLCAAWEIIINLLTPLQMSSFWLTVAMRFLRGLSFPAYQQGFALVSELVPAKSRAIFLGNFWLFWPAGYLTAAALAFLTRDWRQMRLYAYIGYVLYALYILLVPESPRWLATQGRHEEAREILRKLAFYNKGGSKKHSSCILKDGDLPDIELEENKRENVCDLFRGRQMLQRTLCFWILMAGFSVMYYGMALSPNFANPNIFINVILLGCVEIPAGPLAWLLSDRFGRRINLTIFTVLCGLSITAVPFVKYNLAAWNLMYSTAVAMISKFLLTCAFVVADVYMMEIFPTSVRNAGAFTAVMWTQVASIASPFLLPHFEGGIHFYHYVPALCFGAICSVGGICAWFLLPETRGIPMPQTVEEGEWLRRGNEAEWREVMHSKTSLNLVRSLSVVASSNVQLFSKKNIIYEEDNQEEETKLPSSNHSNKETDLVKNALNLRRQNSRCQGDRPPSVTFKE